MDEKAKILEGKLAQSGIDGNPIITDGELLELYQLYTIMGFESNCRYYKAGIFSCQNNVLSILRSRGLP